MPTLFELTATNIAAGGEAVARDDDGRVVFVSGALPGERVEVSLTEEKKDFARARVTRVIEPSADRREPPCPHVARGCGGCGWQHVEPAAQPALKRAVVVDALTRLGRIDSPRVRLGPDLPAEHYRTTVRSAVVDGKAGFRRHHSHDTIDIDTCLVAHPLIDELIQECRFDGALEVTLRAGARTGERLILANNTSVGVQAPPDVLVVSRDEMKGGRRAWYHEEVAGRKWRISATSFFQARPDGAEALIDAARSAIDTHAPDASSLVDLCCGVGLFAGALGEGRKVVAVERHKAAILDAQHNLQGMDVRVVRTGMDEWRAAPADVVVADPARSGLGRVAVQTVVATGASLVVLVSCDPAALGRDAGLLTKAGYRLVDATLIDLFPNTPHIEVVSAFVR